MHERLHMHIERTTPISWIVAAVAGGVLFLLGGVVTTMSSTARFVMASGAIALVALGVYTAVVARRNVTLARRHGEMEAELAQMLRDDTSLRTRVAYTLRDPLTAIFWFADHLANSPEMPFDTRRDMLIAIRNDAREVEQSLSELAGLDGTATGGSIHRSRSAPGRGGCLDRLNNHDRRDLRIRPCTGESLGRQSQSDKYFAQCFAQQQAPDAPTSRFNPLEARREPRSRFRVATIC